MKINECVGCKDFPCLDVNHESYQVSIVVLDPQQVKKYFDNPQGQVQANFLPAISRSQRANSLEAYCPGR